MKLDEYGYARQMKCIEAIKGNCDRRNCFHCDFHTRQRNSLYSHTCDDYSYFSSMASNNQGSFYTLCSATMKPRCIQEGSLEEVMLKIIRKEEHEENKDES